MTADHIKQRDYIPNLGDCVDLVCVAAGWDIDRARDLRGQYWPVTKRLFN